MAATVRIPTSLRGLTDGNREVEVTHGPVAEVIGDLVERFPRLGERLVDEGGSPRRFVNIFVADEDIRFLDGVDTVVDDGVVVTILPAVAGG
ncbi:MAG: MoaD/ThiS family protein [Actinobacteria bacterium]|nr:MoaD/ThiS family protein [Actinomycetota bacterium]MCI0545007.1 MoaD/ThiS family protein [Actinomycetota bacterium]MCI0679321.1 MoaD/ThiS family protein [Actinomycetota bacterium]